MECVHMCTLYTCVHIGMKIASMMDAIFLHRRLTMIYIMIYTIYMRRCSYDEGKGVC